MKKVIITLFATLFAFLLSQTFSFAQQPPIGDDEIIIKEYPLPGDDRSPVLVQAFLTNGEISLSLASSLGVTSITVEDSLGQTVHYTTVDAVITSSVLFAAPTAPDIYSLIIQASSYYGIGHFVVQ